MKFANKMINTTGSPLIRDEICGARRSHDDDNYYRALHYSRSCIGNYESFLQLFERARNIQTHIPSTIHTLTRSLRTEKLCLIIYNESLVCSMSCINNPGKARILILAVTSKMDIKEDGNKRNYIFIFTNKIKILRQLNNYSCKIIVSEQFVLYDYS